MQLTKTFLHLSASIGFMCVCVCVHNYLSLEKGGGPAFEELNYCYCNCADATYKNITTSQFLNWFCVCVCVCVCSQLSLLGKGQGPSFKET